MENENTKKEEKQAIVNNSPSAAMFEFIKMYAAFKIFGFLAVGFKMFSSLLWIAIIPVLGFKILFWLIF